MGLCTVFDENDLKTSGMTGEEIAELKGELDKLKDEYSPDEHSMAKVSAAPHEPFTLDIVTIRHGKTCSRSLEGKLPNHPSAKDVVQLMRELLEGTSA